MFSPKVIHQFSHFYVIYILGLSEWKYFVLKPKRVSLLLLVQLICLCFLNSYFKVFLFLSVSMGMRMLLAVQDLPFVVLLLPWFLIHPFAIKNNSALFCLV